MSRFTTLLSCVVVFTAWVVLAASAADSDPTTSTPAPPPAAGPANYVLTAGDVLRIQVYQEQDLDREIAVSNGGTLDGLPLIGSVRAAGLTVQKLEAEITRRYDADYLVNPQITISVLRYAERRVKVMGAVNAPGIVLIPPADRLTLIDAIARAGDFNRLADRRRVRLTRTGPDGETSSTIIDVREIQTGTSSQVWWVEHDDIIFVPEGRV